MLVAVMPFHAFLSVWMGSLVGHQALWQAWKEIVTLIVALATAVVLWREPAARVRLKRPEVILAIAFGALALLVTLLIHPNLKATVLGIKTDLEFMVLFVAVSIMASQSLKIKIIKTLLVASAIVIGFGMLQIYVLPKDFLINFGYGATSLKPYLTVDPAINAIRILSTLGGPNQLGSFLILPLALVYAMMLNRPRWWHPVYLSGGAVVMWATYSRSAWLGLGVALLVVTIMALPRVWRLPTLLSGVIVAAIGLNLIVGASGRTAKLQYYLFHSTTTDTGIAASTEQHSLALGNGTERFKAQPLGSGLGSAGPASFYSANPFIPESYYLQIAIETGLAGLLLFGAFELAVALRLGALATVTPSASAALGGLLGIAVINLFLHGWADSSTALTYWAFTGAVLGASVKPEAIAKKPVAK